MTSGSFAEYLQRPKADRRFRSRRFEGRKQRFSDVVPIRICEQLENVGRKTREREYYLRDPIRLSLSNGALMACSRGKASPDATTKVQLFAASAGYCQNPDCHRPLFEDIDGKTVHLAEMAHIIAAHNDGPRAKPEVAVAARGRFENLILLCPVCHTKIDKAPDKFPEGMIQGWKVGHQRLIAGLFGVQHYDDRPSVRSALEPLFDENAAIHKELNPDLEYRYDPEAEEADAWKRAMLTRILPNDRKLLMIADANRHLLRDDERELLEAFRTHVHGLINRHISEEPNVAGPRYPAKFSGIFS